MESLSIGQVLGFDRELILGWGLAQVVLSGWWSFEDHGRGWEGAFARAKLVASLQQEQPKGQNSH